jgi:hypothetical protein
MDYREILQEIYNRIFIRDPMRIEKAKLLLEFEETYRKRQEHIAKLKDDAERLENFARSIRSSVSGCGFQKREEEHGAAYYFTKFDSMKMDDYQTIRKNAVESELLGFKVFVLRQKLKLLGVDSSIKDWEAGIIE